MNRHLYILGAGGLAKELGAYIKHINSDFMLSGFFDDSKNGKVGKLGDILGTLDQVHNLDPESSLVVGVGDPNLKEKFFTEIKKPERFRFPSFILPEVYLADNKSIHYGRGTFICSGSSLTTDIRIGDFCLINLNCSIGHDVSIGDYSSIMPGVNISGNVKIGKGVLIGAGATILPNRNIGDYAIIGAGAVVTKDVSEGQTVVGVPAKLFNRK